MRKEEFEKFIKEQLGRFRKTYRVRGINRKELKRSIYDNKNLSDDQKDYFWELVEKND